MRGCLLSKPAIPRFFLTPEVKVYEVRKVYVDENGMAKVDAEFKYERLNGKWTVSPTVDLTEAADAATEKLQMRGKGKAIFIRWTTPRRYKY